MGALKLVATIVVTLALAASAQPAAADDPPLVLIALATPQFAAPNSTVNITVRAFLGATPVDLEGLTLTAEVPESASLTTEHAGLGHYSSVFTLPESPGDQSTYFVEANGSRGGVTATAFTWVTVSRPPAPYWTIDLAYVGPPASLKVGLWHGTRQVLPGERVEVEARTEFGLAPADPDSPSSYVFCPTGYPWRWLSSRPNLFFENLTVARTSIGVFRVAYNAPDRGGETFECALSFGIRIPGPNNSTSGYGASLFAYVVPFPLMAWVRTANLTAGTWGVEVGDEAPVEGASVVMDGVFSERTGQGTETESRLYASTVTDAHGYAELSYAVNRSGRLDLWLNVTWGGRTSTLSLFAGLQVDDGRPRAFVPEILSAASFSAAFQSPWPAGAPLGSAANYTLRAASHGVPLPNETVYYYTYNAATGIFYGAGTERADGGGNFSVPVEITRETLGAGATIRVVDPGHGEDEVSLGATRMDEPYPMALYLLDLPSEHTVNVDANRTAEGVLVRLSLGANRSGEPVAVWAALVPWGGPASSCAPKGFPPQAWNESVPASDGTARLRLTLPAWYPEGSYCLMTRVGNGSWISYDWAKVEIGPATMAPPANGINSGGSTGGFAWLFEAGPLILAILVLTIVTVAAALRLHRRPGERGPL